MGTLRRGAPGWRIVIGLGVSAAALALALRGVDLGLVGAAITAADGRLLILALGSYLLTMVAKAARWRLLLSVQTAPTLSRTFTVLTIGLLANALVPARLGEVVRAYLMGEREALSKAFVLGTIAIEKALDLALLTIASLLLLSQVALPDWLAGPVKASAAILTLLVAATILLMWNRKLAARAGDWLRTREFPGWFDWVLRQAEQALLSLRILERPRLSLALLAWTLAVLALGTSTNYLVLAAMGLSLPAWAPLFLLVVLLVGVAVPSSPGQIGVFHYLTVLALSVFGVPKEVALGCGVVLHLIVYVPTVLIGVWCLWRESLTWRSLTEAADSVRGSVRGAR